jgi:hypothetical protein
MTVTNHSRLGDGRGNREYGEASVAQGSPFKSCGYSISLLLPLTWMQSM